MPDAVSLGDFGKSLAHYWGWSMAAPTTTCVCGVRKCGMERIGGG